MSKSRILVVEDERLVAIDLAESLDKLGYGVLGIADSTDRAIAKSRELHPDLVLMDIQLIGRGDGIEAAAFIRRNLEIPIVFVTAHADSTTLQRAATAEPYGYIVKPFEEHGLHATVETALHRAKAEAKLRKLERWLSTMLRSIGDAVIATDSQGRVSYLNPVAEKLTGWPLHEALGRDMVEVFRATNAASGELIASPAQIAMREGIVVELAPDTRLQARDGRVIPIDDVAAPIRDDEDQIIGAVVIFRDDSGRHQAEQEIRRLNEELEKRVQERTAELQASTAQLEAFVHSIAHDLRAPLRAMQGFAHTLGEQYGPVLDETGRDYARRVSESAQFMDRLIADLLALNRVSQQDMVLASVKLERAVHSALARHEKVIREKYAQVELLPLLPAVLAHESTLGQVLSNLISNALKFTAANVPPHIRIRAEEEAATVRLWIEDNGIGLPPEQQERIFRVFQRLHTSEYPGTGIGLAIVQKGVERMGGRVGVESTPGQGSCFWIQLAKPL